MTTKLGSFYGLGYVAAHQTKLRAAKETRKRRVRNKIARKSRIRNRPPKKHNHTRN